MKVLYSTAQASVVETVTSCGVTIWRRVSKVSWVGIVVVRAFRQICASDAADVIAAIGPTVEVCDVQVRVLQGVVQAYECYAVSAF